MDTDYRVGLNRIQDTGQVPCEKILFGLGWIQTTGYSVGLDIGRMVGLDRIQMKHKIIIFIVSINIMRQLFQCLLQKKTSPNIYWFQINFTIEGDHSFGVPSRRSSYIQSIFVLYSLLQLIIRVYSGWLCIVESMKHQIQYKFYF